MMTFGKIDQRRNQQRLLLHQTQHGQLLKKFVPFLTRSPAHSGAERSAKPLFHWVIPER
jgi:hypothetical protein